MSDGLRGRSKGASSEEVPNRELAGEVRIVGVWFGGCVGLEGGGSGGKMFKGRSRATTRLRWVQEMKLVWPSEHAGGTQKNRRSPRVHDGRSAGEYPHEDGGKEFDIAVGEAA